uniref:Uncharacterized protein n=1 Tax=Oryza meridionalis TaxID=40149 RepID=A0A0E0D346_9ORYZ
MLLLPAPHRQVGRSHNRVSLQDTTPRQIVTMDALHAAMLYNKACGSAGPSLRLPRQGKAVRGFWSSLLLREGPQRQALQNSGLGLNAAEGGLILVSNNQPGPNQLPNSASRMSQSISQLIMKGKQQNQGITIFPVQAIQVGYVVTANLSLFNWLTDVNGGKVWCNFIFMQRVWLLGCGSKNCLRSPALFDNSMLKWRLLYIGVSLLFGVLHQLE